MLMIEPHLSIAGGFKKQVKRHFKLKPAPFNLYPNQKAAMVRLIAAFLRHK